MGFHKRDEVAGKEMKIRNAIMKRKNNQKK
jgi:hypothetical protein